MQVWYRMLDLRGDRTHLVRPCSRVALCGLLGVLSPADLMQSAVFPLCPLCARIAGVPGPTVPDPLEA